MDAIRRSCRYGRTVRVPESLLPHLRRSRDLADRCFAEPLDLDGLAAAAHISKYHFIRCFTAAYGTTPAAYLAERRIERAQDLLRATNLTVTEVCMLVGYTSLGSFSTKFRQLVGVSPSAYQESFASTGAPRIPGCYVFMLGLHDRRDRPGDDPATTEKPVALGSS
jgi:AraC-like DNA-binding protein